ncbi:TIR domain-containing protein [Roseomonas sp. ROY-5-3]|uniref:TIR domain-containing protein n=2 Tax=Acetobacterales TaxID=3120395 RepID=A0ABS6H561_9PROT|nr:TIR domain-containing protein [Roseomonas oleicola]
MDAVRSGTTPDHAKWSSTNSFIRAYTDAALQYKKLTNDRTVNIYDISRLAASDDKRWPVEKGQFDTIYADIVVLQKLLTQPEEEPLGPLYNLFVSGLDDSWSGVPFHLELSRCLREYTDGELTERFGRLDSASISELKRYPCIFAYESGIQKAPLFGFIREIDRRQNEVRVDYHLVDVHPFLTANELSEMRFELDLSKLELYRTHWALKRVDLAKELHRKNIALPSSAADIKNSVDISNHVFDVALSFPGEARELVEKISHELERSLGPNAYFYDDNYTSQLARPSLDTLLQGIYSRAKLDVVFAGSDYQAKNWCGVEFRAIREIIQRREHERVMLVRLDDGEVEGILKVDGYVDARRFGPEKIAEFIVDRIGLIKSKE